MDGWMDGKKQRIDISVSKGTRAPTPTSSLPGGHLPGTQSHPRFHSHAHCARILSPLAPGTGTRVGAGRRRAPSPRIVIVIVIVIGGARVTLTHSGGHTLPSSSVARRANRRRTSLNRIESNRIESNRIRKPTTTPANRKRYRLERIVRPSVGPSVGVVTRASIVVVRRTSYVVVTSSSRAGSLHLSSLGGWSTDRPTLDGRLTEGRIRTDDHLVRVVKHKHTHTPRCDAMRMRMRGGWIIVFIRMHARATPHRSCERRLECEDGFVLRRRSCSR